MEGILEDSSINSIIDSSDNSLLNGVLNTYDSLSFARLDLKEKKVFAILLATLIQLAKEKGQTDKLNLINAKIESLKPSASASAPAAGGKRRKTVKRKTVKRKTLHKK